MNIDPVVFTPQKAYVLGPTTTPRPVPVMPMWQCQRFAPQTVHRAFTEEVMLPVSGITEMNVAAGKGTNLYGISFANEISLEFDRKENTLSVRNKEGLIAREKLLAEYDHGALHCIRLEYGSNVTIYIDNLMRLKAEVAIGGLEVSYFADGDLTVGSATVHTPDKDQLHYPVPCFVPGDRGICFDVTSRGTCQLLALGCKDGSGEIFVDGNALMPDCVDQKNGVAFYRCNMETGSHILQTDGVGAETVGIAPHYGSGSDALSVQDMGPYDKIRGTEKWTNINISADMDIAERGEGWQAGVIFRADHLADGGEGNDKVLGTNFFVGYRVCVTEEKIQLWKHRYDEHLLKEIPYDGGDHISFQIIAAGNVISLRMNDDVIMEYQDPMPIMCGYNGFHVRNCIIKEGTIN